MSRLDEIFSDALQHEATTPSGEQLAAVAEVTIHRARRHRRARAAVEVVAALVIVAAGFVVGSMVLGSDATPPAGTPGPSAPWPEPITEADSRMPQAPSMTGLDWDHVDASWDVEFASYVNLADGRPGYTVAAYLTPPGGQRLLAYSDGAFDMANPVLLGWDSIRREALVLNLETNELAVVNLRTGVSVAIDNAALGDIRGGWPLGKASDGKSYFVLAAPAVTGGVADTIFRFDGGAAVPVFSVSGLRTSPVWNDTVAMSTGQGLEIRDVKRHASTIIAGTKNCSFVAWTVKGTFMAQCVTSDDKTNTVEVDPGTGKTTPAADIDPFSVQWSAIDRTRLLTGASLAYTNATPPQVDNGGGATVDLGAGFTSTPDTYSVLFGTRS